MVDQELERRSICRVWRMLDNYSQPAGDFLFKGAQVNQTGSLAWILLMVLTKISDGTIDQLITDGSNRVITWSGATNSALNIHQWFSN